MANVNEVYPITLRTADGRECKMLAWFPNEVVRKDFYTKARKRGMEVTENDK